MKEKFLPIGTVVLLKNATKKIMITGYLPISKDKERTIYDYSACVFPEGLISSNQTAVFNHEQIAEIISEGYSNEETEKLVSALHEILSKEKANNPSEFPSETPSLETAPVEETPIEQPVEQPVEVPKLEEEVHETLDMPAMAPEPVAETPTEVEMPAPVEPELPLEVDKVEEPSIEETKPVEEPKVGETITPTPEMPTEVPEPNLEVAPVVDPVVEPTGDTSESSSNTVFGTEPVDVGSIKPFSE